MEIYLSLSLRAFGLSSLLALIGEYHQWDEAHVQPQRQQRIIISIVFLFCTEVSLSLVVSSLMNVPFYFIRALVIHQRLPMRLILLSIQNYKFCFSCQKILKFLKGLTFHCFMCSQESSKDKDDEVKSKQSYFLVERLKLLLKCPSQSCSSLSGPQAYWRCSSFLVAALSSDAHQLDLINNIFYS